MKGIPGLACGLCLILAWAGCRQPAFDSPARPVVMLHLAFADGTVEIGLDRRPPAGAWLWMDAGLWSPLDLAWPAPDRGHADIARTAPDWLMLRDPSGMVHRLVLQDRKDAIPMPRPSRMHDPESPTEEDREAFAALALAWVLFFTRH